MQLIGIKNKNPVDALVGVLWAHYGFVSMRLQDWGTPARWLEGFNVVRDTDDVVVSDLRDEQDVDLVQSLGGVVLRL